jgi:hypothetical protein
LTVRQISLSLDNTVEQLSVVIDSLAENGIGVIALNVVDAAGVRVVKFVTNDPDKTIEVLKSLGYSVEQQNVLAVEAPKHPGGLNAVLHPLKTARIGVKHLYSCLIHGDKTVLIVDVDKMEEAVSALKKNWIHLFGEELYSM